MSARTEIPSAVGAQRGPWGEALALAEALELMDGDALLLRELLGLFLQTASANLRRIHEALRAGDLDACAIQVHSLKGSASNVGAQSLANLARAMEEEALCRNQECLLELTAELEGELVLLQEAVREVEWPAGP